MQNLPDRCPMLGLLKKTLHDVGFIDDIDCLAKGLDKTGTLSLFVHDMSQAQAANDIQGINFDLPKCWSNCFSVLPLCQ